MILPAAVSDPMAARTTAFMALLFSAAMPCRFESSIALTPDAPAFHSNLGEAYRKLRRLDEAIAAYRRAIQLKPDLPEAHTNLGNALADQGQLDEAIAAHHRAIPLREEAFAGGGVRLRPKLEGELF